MTAAGARTRPVVVGGSGHVRRPHDRPLQGAAHRRAVRGPQPAGLGRERGEPPVRPLVVENSYVDIADAEIENGAGPHARAGRFSLGFPRRDGGEEMRARIQMFDWPVRDLRHAFVLDDYPVERPAVR